MCTLDTLDVVILDNRNRGLSHGAEQHGQGPGKLFQGVEQRLHKVETRTHISQKESQSHSITSDSATPWTIQSLEFSRPEYSSGQPFRSPGDLPNPRIEPRSPTLQTDSLPAKPQGKPKNTGVGSHSVLQGIFSTQELNLSLLHCRQILYQLATRESLSSKKKTI